MYINTDVLNKLEHSLKKLTMVMCIIWLLGKLHVASHLDQLLVYRTMLQNMVVQFVAHESPQEY